MAGQIKKHPFIALEDVIKKMTEVLGYNLLKRDHKKDDRKRESVERRAQWYYFMYKFTSLSLTEVGRQMHFNHATIIHSIKKYTDTYIFYSEHLKINHIILNDFFEEVVKKNKAFMLSQGMGKTDVMTSDFKVIRQKIIIGKLLMETITLREDMYFYKEYYKKLNKEYKKNPNKHEYNLNKMTKHKYYFQKQGSSKKIGKAIAESKFTAS
jgi:hypothetical protein